MDSTDRDAIIKVWKVLLILGLIVLLLGVIL